jgi:hypothetical protein
MMPCQSLDLEDKTLDRLTGAFKGKPVIEKILKIYASRVQTLEDQIWKVLTSRLLGVSYANVVPDNGECCDCGDLLTGQEAEVSLDAEGSHLDTVGKLVGEARFGRSDAEYLVAIRVRVLVNKAHGLARNIVEVAQQSAPPGIVTTYEEFPDAAFEVGSYNAFGGRTLAQKLGQTRMAGVRGVLRTSNWDPVSPGDVVWGSSVGTVANARGLGHTTDSDYSRFVDMVECVP